MEPIARILKIACIQLKVGANKTENVSRAISKIRDAKSQGSELVMLPECFNSPYGTKYFAEYAEEIPNGVTCKQLSAISKELEIFLIAGSIPERIDHQLYNTCTIWGPNGHLLSTYRKAHLFDVDIPGEITFKESDTLSAGSTLTTIGIREFKIGVGICHDIRFEELAKLYRKRGCNVLVYPAAFEMKTGALLWDLSGRSRSSDNQCYTCLISPARDATADYVTWGHSLVVDPWARIVQQASSDETIIYADLDLDLVDKVRSNIPIHFQRRIDIYDTVEK